MGAAVVGMTRRGPVSLVRRRPGGVWGDAAPGQDAGEAEVVEPLGLVVGDAGGEEGALPLDGGGFEAF